MALSMYSGFVPVCLQLLGGLKNVLQKAEAHATEQKWDPAVVLNLRLYPDMFTLERQVRQVCTHALGARPGRRDRSAEPPRPGQQLRRDAVAHRQDRRLPEGVRANQLDGKEDSQVTVTVGGQPREFKSQNYLYHFAMLQVQFHATTAYDIIRHVGVKVGKRDYLGQMPS